MKNNRSAEEENHCCLENSDTEGIRQSNNSGSDNSEIPSCPIVTSEEEKWSRGKFQIQELLNEDAHYEIYRIEHKETNELAFLKICKQHYEYKSKYMSEKYIWKIASLHPNIVKMYCTYWIGQSKAYVFEHLSLGNLRNFIKVHKVLQTKVTKGITAQIISAVEFLHYKDIFHRNVSSRCILLNANGEAKLFGFSHALMNKTSRGVHGNLYYQAPEVFSGKVYDRTADWYSLGVCLYEMVIGMTPVEYHCMRNGIRFKELDYAGKIVVMLTSSVYIPKIFPKNLKEMLEGLLQKSKEKRFGYKDNVQSIKNHPFFSDVDWEKCELGLLKVDLPKMRKSHLRHNSVLNK